MLQTIRTRSKQTRPEFVFVWVYLRDLGVHPWTTGTNGSGTAGTAGTGSLGKFHPSLVGPSNLKSGQYRTTALPTRSIHTYPIQQARRLFAPELPFIILLLFLLCGRLFPSSLLVAFPSSSSSSSSSASSSSVSCRFCLYFNDHSVNVRYLDLIALYTIAVPLI